MTKLRFMALLSICILFTNCEEDKTYVPKPMGYVRVDLPEHQYKKMDSICPYYFEYSQLAELEGSRSNKKCNKNVHYDRFDATIHLSYITIDTGQTLHKLIEDARNFAYGHQVKASSIQTELVVKPRDTVYGLKYEITGDAASPMQFYVTDSTSHFLRGALYFNTTPNYDSLRPYINYIHKDIRHMINTTRWIRPK